MRLPRPIARLILAVSGWRAEGDPPSEPKYVLISQHTSNWDFFWMLAFTAWFRIDVAFVGKDTLFRPPFGWLMRKLGGIPVDRSAPHHLVDTLVAELRARDRLVLGIAPEGTRHRVDHWKSGFYAVAAQAGVPIVCARLDYAKRVAGFGLVLRPSGDVHADMDRIRAFYAEQTPKIPAFAGPVRLKDED